MKLLRRIKSAMLIASAVFTSGTAMADNNVSFPDLSSTYLRTGHFVNMEDLQKVDLGLTSHQVRLLLGNPHFSEGLGGPDVFNYAFNFYTNRAARQYITCQYQVQYNNNGKVSGTFWKDRQCEEYVAHYNDKPAPVAPPQPVRQPISLSADGLFAFGKSSFADLLPEGRQKLTTLAQGIRNGYDVKGIDVVGFTDRIGSDSGNLALSYARAQTVKSFLSQNGIPAETITARGFGAANPVVSCPGGKSAAIIACLQPNRRVEISINGINR